MKIKVALAEDNNSLASSIRERLEFFKDDIEFRFRAINGKDMLEKLSKENDIDTILMDIEMPEMDGIECTYAVKEKYPEIKIIILTVFDDEEKIFNAIQAGAMGYLLKDEPPAKIQESIKMIMSGGAPMSPTIAAKSLEILRNPEIAKSTRDKSDFAISQRENDVLVQLSKGLNYNEIAENLFISPSTVRKHIENIYRKLQVNNKVQAVQKAIRHKII